MTHIEVENSRTVNLIIAGNTYAFRSRLDAFGMIGGYDNAPAEEGKKAYYRILKGLDISDAAQQERILSLFGEAVLKHLAMRIVIDEKHLIPDTHTSKPIAKLRQLPYLHFAA